MSHADVAPGFSGRRRRWQVGASLLAAALAFAVLPGVADAKKKRDKIGIATYNLYLGSDLGDATAAGLASRTDLFADEVGRVLNDVEANDFNTRSRGIAKEIKKKKVDLIGLQEAALWKIQLPSDATPLAPSSVRAGLVTYDYVERLLDDLNKGAKSKKQCGKQRKKAKATPNKKDNRKAARCYRGYTLVVEQQEADLEFFGDFDRNPGPDGKTCDFSSGACPNPYPTGGGGAGSDSWLWGNDDTGISFGEPPAAECSDGRDNDGDGLVDYGPIPGTNETSGPSPAAGFPGQPAAPPWDCNSRLDDDEASADNAGFPLGGPQGAPQDTNMDNHIYTGDAGAAPGGLPDALGNGLDPSGTTDCADNNPDPGPSVGDDLGGAAPPWDAPNFGAARVDVCLFHGIDGDVSLTMRDAILKRKGAGVKTRNERSNNFSNKFVVSVFGGAQTIPFTRGWTATDAKVRGKKFTFVNTHLESESNGSIREDQASELIAPGGPATEETTVLVGDLNSDPNRPPANLPNGDGGSSIAINRLLNAGFSSLIDTPGFATGSHGDHGDIINDATDVLGEGWIDHILTNNPDEIERKGKPKLLDKFLDNGLWTSDHAGVLVRIKGKKR